MAPARKRTKRFEEESMSSSDAGGDSETEMGFGSDQSEDFDQFDDDDDGGSDPESNSDEEDEDEAGEDEEEEGSGAEGIGRTKDAEMEELEKEMDDLRKQQDLLNNLKRHKDEDAIKGQAVKNQKVLWDRTLEFRFLLQKPFSSSNKLPQEPIKSSFCSSDKLVDQSYSDLISSCKETIDSLLGLQEALLEKNPSILQGTGNDIHKDEDLSRDFGEADEEWLSIHKMHCRIAPFRNNSVDKWHRKTQVTTGAAAFKGKLQAFNQNISEQVAGYMRDPSRMIKRMQLRRSSVGVLGKITEDSEMKREEDGDVNGDPELVDDVEFYQQLLKEFFESCDLSSSETAFYALKKLQPKKRKLVDRRASKSRKIRYHVHEKIANFMAPIRMDLPPMAPKLFENLFGLGNQKTSSIP
ncbi:uncharacterized protein A4U43_C04F32050 [Asparagus officinalis]|uniref:Apoptosis-antagonizing transcription factor C-terminal domain-containing protein n=1 Tax=Asparagus officinalis TaxID=4686 RepID=A0A5P1F5V3_ASPOF|nr:putative uncharacterized protein DDB_G0270496 [Asparagus officinalis]ONK73484.1 uncharacterized protein A4U43_C04F32050 [Asparagus officinalis]